MRLWADVVISYTSIGEKNILFKRKKRRDRDGEWDGRFNTINWREIK